MTTISGKWEFEKVSGTVNGLDYANPVRKPIRRAVTELITVANNQVVATTATGEDGTYSFDFTGTGAVKVRIKARTTAPVDIQVEDNTSGDAIWSVDSADIPTAGSPITNQNFVAGLGWGGTSYTSSRSSAAFNVLDVCQLCSERVLAARSDIVLPALKVNWSPNNTTTGGDIAIGNISTSHYSPATKELFILGKENVDTDEFDDHTLGHEWGHFFEDNASRSDSQGGSHSSGDILVPTVAFGEGFGYGIAGVLLGPNRLNVDTTGNRQESGAGAYDIEDNDAAGVDGNRGWFSERSVGFVFYDLFDSNVDGAWDNVELGLKPILDVLTGPQKTTTAQTSIFTFVSALKQQNPASAAAIDALCAKHLISAVADEWGTGEANSHVPGLAFMLPVYEQMAVGGAAGTVTLQGKFDGNSTHGTNKAPANRFVRFVGNGNMINISVATPAGAGNDIVLILRRGQQVLGGIDAVSGGGTESLPAFQSTAGQTYVLQIQALVEVAIPYQATVTIL